MKSLLAISLFVFYTVALVRPVYPLEYMVRLEEYKARCINKAKPEMHCNGKCVLMQKLRALNREEPGPVAPVLPKINLDDFPFCITGDAPLQLETSTTGTSYNVFPDVSKPKNIIVDIFRPPQA